MRADRSDMGDHRLLTIVPAQHGNAELFADRRIRAISRHQQPGTSLNRPAIGKTKRDAGSIRRYHDGFQPGRTAQFHTG